MVYDIKILSMNIEKDNAKVTFYSIKMFKTEQFDINVNIILVIM